MPSPPWAFLLDENMPKRAATALPRAGYSVACVVEVGLRAQKDPVIFAYACRHGFIIVTRDADFLAFQYQPPTQVSSSSLSLEYRDVLWLIPSWEPSLRSKDKTSQTRSISLTPVGSNVWSDREKSIRPWVKYLVESSPDPY